MTADSTCAADLASENDAVAPARTNARNSASSVRLGPRTEPAHESVFESWTPCFALARCSHGCTNTFAARPAIAAPRTTSAMAVMNTPAPPRRFVRATDEKREMPGRLLIAETDHALAAKPSGRPTTTTACGPGYANELSAAEAVG